MHGANFATLKDILSVGKIAPVKTLLILFLFLVALTGCYSRQRYHHFQTSTPFPKDHYLVLGFLGGRESWNSTREGVRRLALELRELNLSHLHVETVENVRRDLALRFIEKGLDRNRDGKLQDHETASARVILYGQSFGGAAVVKLARELKKRNIPVLLTVQIDSVGRNDDTIPDNVRFAANLFQRNGRFIRGEPVIHAENPAKTTILGNFEFDYRRKKIDLSSVRWWKKIFRVDHTKMNLDPAVWSKVKELILQHLAARRAGVPARQDPISYPLL